jgi:LPXTG-motif cell wall-anchored protein
LRIRVFICVLGAICWGLPQKKGGRVARRIVLVVVAAAIMAMMLVVAAAPAVVAQEKGKKGKEMPKTGGISPGNVALVGLGASALLVGGGLLVHRRTNLD